MKKFYLIQFFAFVILSFLTIIVGQKYINISEIFTADNLFVLKSLRIPPFLTALIAGFIFSTSGLIIQLFFKNDLATPYTLGISSAGIFGLIIGLKFNINYEFAFIDMNFVFSTVGSFVLLIFLFKLAPKNSSFIYFILLIGISLNIFFNSAIMLVQYFSNMAELYQITHYLIGSIEQTQTIKLILPLFFLILQTIFIFYYAPFIDLISVNHEMAVQRGVNVKKIFYIILFFQSLTLGAILPITGPVAFVGLIIPNLIRILFKEGIKKLYIITLIAGGNFLLFCYLISINILNGQILPIGIITSIFGSIFLIVFIFFGNKR